MAEISDERFRELLTRTRAGDHRAANELVESCQSEIQRVVRYKLSDKMRRTLDSIDICQSVIADFYVRLGKGQFDLNSPGDMIRLLVTMARNKVIYYHRIQEALIRGGGRKQVDGSEVMGAHAQPGPGPATLVEGQEYAQEIYRRMSPEVRVIFDRRAEGLEWNELAAELNEKPDALRKRFTRALEEIREALGLNGEPSDSE